MKSGKIVPRIYKQVGLTAALFYVIAVAGMLENLQTRAFAFIAVGLVAIGIGGGLMLGLLFVERTFYRDGQKA